MTRLVPALILVLTLLLPLAASAATSAAKSQLPVLPSAPAMAALVRYDVVPHHPDGKPIIREAGRFLAGTRGSWFAYLLLAAKGPAALPALGGLAVGGAGMWAACRYWRC